MAFKKGQAANPTGIRGAIGKPFKDALIMALKEVAEAAPR